ncbi:hypothetical protein [Pararhizobium sp. IMCC21322]|uniref:hypothetical protein n=1 Tax=Pararhizobium sp. IMCC21322 TaxID=3067903 RepID=UPI0027410B1F|nr:hypothetical protein [Pararhizobium sp. IMCC21322]
MNDRDMKLLLDKMHASSDSVLSADNFSKEVADDAEILAQAQELKDQSGLRLAQCTSEFIQELIARRHKTGNFQYPFPQFDEFPNASAKP